MGWPRKKGGVGMTPLANYGIMDMTISIIIMQVTVSVVAMYVTVSISN